MRKRIRGGSGLGDSLYVQAIVRYLVNELGQEMTVASPHSELFRQFGDRVEVIPHCKNNMQYVAHYAPRKQTKGTTQFQDCCINCGVPRDIPLKLDWPGPSGNLTLRTRQEAAGRPIVLVQMPRMPFSRSDPFGIELLPGREGLQHGIDAIKESGAFTVKVGKGSELYSVHGIDLDLSNRTDLRDLLELSNIADAGFGQVSFIIPLMESFGKPVLSVVARKGLSSRNPFISSITPEKVNHYASSISYVDDQKPRHIMESVQSLWQKIAS